MDFKYLFSRDKLKIENLFTHTFTSSEGEKEGILIGQLSAKLSEGINNEDIICIGACENDKLIGSIFFSKLSFETEIDVYMLAPVAIHPQYQRKGIGTSLINWGIDELRNKDTDIIVTYGDPSFYSRFGFQKITEEVIKAPFKLTMPYGWLALSMYDNLIPCIKTRPTCVKAFENPAYW